MDAITPLEAQLASAYAVDITAQRILSNNKVNGASPVSARLHVNNSVLSGSYLGAREKSWTIWLLKHNTSARLGTH